jgi:hypothetical protein
MDGKVGFTTRPARMDAMVSRAAGFCSCEGSGGGAEKGVGASGCMREYHRSARVRLAAWVGGMGTEDQDKLEVDVTPLGGECWAPAGWKGAGGGPGCAVRTAVGGRTGCRAERGLLAGRAAGGVVSLGVGRKVGGGSAAGDEGGAGRVSPART